MVPVVPGPADERAAIAFRSCAARKSSSDNSSLNLFAFISLAFLSFNQSATQGAFGPGATHNHETSLGRWQGQVASLVSDHDLHRSFQCLFNRSSGRIPY